VMGASGGQDTDIHVPQSAQALEPVDEDPILPGGELEVEVGEDLRVHLSGWALPVFAGRLGEESLKELRQLP